jgi:hypothetical protein
MADLELFAEIAVMGIDELKHQFDWMGDAADGLAGIFDTAMHSIEASLAVGTAAFVGFTTSAIQEATKIEMLTAQYGVLRGSIEKGAEAIKTLREYARDSLNTFDTLDAAGRKVESGGLTSARWVPIIDLLATMKGGGAQSAMQFADALVRIGSGSNMGMAMRLFSGFVSYNDLRGQGVKVSKGNHIESDPGEVLQAIDNVVRKKFGGMREALSKTMAVGFSDVQDAWLYLLDSFGKGWFPLIRNIISSVQPFVEFLASSGEATKIATAFAAAFQSIFNAAGGGNSIAIFLSYVVATMEMLPGIIATVGKVTMNVAKAIFNFVDTVMIKGLNNLISAGLEVANAFRGFVVAIVGAENRFSKMMGHQLISDADMAKVNKPFEFKPFKGVLDIVGRGLDAFGGGDLSNVNKNFGARQSQIMADFNKYLKQPHEREDHSKDPIFNDLHLVDQKIQENTRQTAEHTKATMEAFKSYILGGGDRGKAGISVAEMYGHPAGGRMQVDVRSGNVHLDRFLSELLADYHSGYRRAGLMGGN